MWQEVFGSGFANTSAISPFATVGNSNTSTPPAQVLQTVENEQHKKTPSAFAASAFAALSGSSTSPFGTIGSSSTTQGKTFGSALNHADYETRKSADVKSGENLSSTNSRLSSSESHGPGGEGRPSFAVPNTFNPSPFGGAVSGGGFGRIFGGGAKLTNFAAPVGDAPLGGGNEPIQAFGAPSKDEDNEENSDSEDRGPEDSAKDDTSNGTDTRFHHQEGNFQLIDSCLMNSSNLEQLVPVKTVKRPSFHLHESTYIHGMDMRGRREDAGLLNSMQLFLRKKTPASA